ncbi:MAG: hypothetical protein LRY27_00880 [Chitinophagales bacterium]|nr:hypothetical protein [Chitinophagales bacterium]
MTSILFGYTPLQAKPNALKKHTLILRTGLKVPTGNYNVNNVNYSLGTGSFDMLFFSYLYF